MKLRLFEIASGGVRSAVHRLQGYSVRGYGTTGGDGEQHDDAPFIGQPIGFASRPTIRAGLRALGLVAEDDSVSLLALVDRAISHATEIASGETRVYASSEPRVCVRLLGGLIEIRVNASGEIRLAPDAGDYKGEAVARKTDDVQVTIAPGTVVVGGSGTVLNAVPITLSGVITSGATKVKA